MTFGGYVQENQIPMEKNNISSVGLSTLNVDGDFSLEIDYINAVNTHETYGDLNI